MLVALLAMLAFLAPFYVIYKPPHVLIRYFQYRWSDVLWHVPLRQKTIALTIDDAPSPFTRDIVALLHQHDAKATFFIIGGQVRGREAHLQAIVAAGHELGNHAMHDEPSRSLPAHVLAEQLVEVESYINATYADAGAERPPRRLFRPGSGLFTTLMRQQVRRLGYQMVLGSVYPHDAQIAYPTLNAKHILSMVRPGSIVVCHDRRSWTVPMLTKVLPELKRRGYTVTTISGLLDAKRTEEMG
ncbi:hypothetical protein ACEQ8H_003687 [Pleosporales sp. CAS-2024a]